MCTYGIGLPFDHPIWKSLPPCHCGLEVPESIPTTTVPIADWLRRLPEIFPPKVDDEPDPIRLVYGTSAN